MDAIGESLPWELLQRVALGLVDGGKFPDNFKIPTSGVQNTALLRVATDAFIFIDANRTSYFDLQRTLTHMESDKIRGLVALGT